MRASKVGSRKVAIAATEDEYSKRLVKPLFIMFAVNKFRLSEKGKFVLLLKIQYSCCSSAAEQLYKRKRGNPERIIVMAHTLDNRLAKKH